MCSSSVACLGPVDQNACHGKLPTVEGSLVSRDMSSLQFWQSHVRQEMDVHTGTQGLELACRERGISNSV